jgi:hypothetical protein
VSASHLKKFEVPVCQNRIGRFKGRIEAGIAVPAALMTREHELVPRTQSPATNDANDSLVSMNTAYMLMDLGHSVPRKR